MASIDPFGLQVLWVQRTVNPVRPWRPKDLGYLRLWSSPYTLCAERQLRQRRLMSDVHELVARQNRERSRLDQMAPLPLFFRWFTDRL